MLNSVDFSGRPFHFIGIGGIGMSALAYVIAKKNVNQKSQKEAAMDCWKP